MKLLSKTWRKAACLLCALLLLAMPLTAGAVTVGGTAYVVTANLGPLNVRTGPSLSNGLMATLPYGTAVTVLALSTDGNWSQIRYLGTSVGWVMNRYLSSTAPGGSSGSTEDIAALFRSFQHVSTYNVSVQPSSPTGFVNLRWAPSKSAGVMETCRQGYVLQVISVGTDWCQVVDPLNGYTGFMMTAFLNRIS